METKSEKRKQTAQAENILDKIDFGKIISQLFTAEPKQESPVPVSETTIIINVTIGNKRRGFFKWLLGLFW